MEFGSLDSREDGEHTDVGFVEISKILVMRGALFIGTELFDRILPAMIMDSHHTSINTFCNSVIKEESITLWGPVVSLSDMRASERFS